MTDVLVMIPAKRQSRGLAGKNLHPICGKPMVSWTIEQALAADVGPVIVVTDDKEIASLAHRYEVPAYTEPAHLASDTASMESVMAWVLDQCREGDGKVPDWFMVLQPTSPLRLSPMIREAWAVAKTGAFNSVFSVVSSAHCSWRLKDKTLSVEWPQRGPLKRMTRQEAGQQWTENGAIYCVKVERFLTEDTRFCPPMYLYEMPLWTGFQVDSPEELALIELIMRTRVQLGSDGIRT